MSCFFRSISLRGYVKNVSLKYLCKRESSECFQYLVLSAREASSDIMEYFLYHRWYTRFVCSKKSGNTAFRCEARVYVNWLTFILSHSGSLGSLRSQEHLFLSFPYLTFPLLALYAQTLLSLYLPTRSTSRINMRLECIWIPGWRGVPRYRLTPNSERTGRFITYLEKNDHGRVDIVSFILKLERNFKPQGYNWLDIVYLRTT